MVRRRRGWCGVEEEQENGMAWRRRRGQWYGVEERTMVWWGGGGEKEENGDRNGQNDMRGT
jgi:hypothetical protein